jgi:hypothetical protein
VDDIRDMTAKWGKVKGMPTTRSFPRTLDEAYPNDPSRFNWFYPPERNISLPNIALGMTALALWVIVIYLITAP